MLKKGSLQENTWEEEEKYQFVQEEIRPQRRLCLIRFFRKLLVVMMFAIIFGALAGGAFTLICNVMGSDHLIQAREAMLQGTNLAELSFDDGGSYLSEGESLEEYETFWQKIAALGSLCNASIVKVQDTSDESAFQKSGLEVNAQSGIVFSKTKDCYYILTYDNDFSKAESVEAEFATGEAVTASVSGTDDVLGITVLEVERKKLSEGTEEALQVIEFGNTSVLEIGTPVIAVGSPNGVMKSVMVGHLVNVGLTSQMTDSEVSLYSTDIEYCESGNGFVVDIQGQLVGMLTNAYPNTTGKTNCAFMDLWQMKSLLFNLAEGKKMAYFGIMGCSYTEETGYASSQEESQGVYITNVLPDSPAYEGQIRVADVITEINDQAIHNLQEMRECLLNCKAGDTINVVVVRTSGKKQTEKKMKVILSEKTP